MESQDTREFHTPSLLGAPSLFPKFFPVFLWKIVSPVQNSDIGAAPLDPVQKSYSTVPPFTRVSLTALKSRMSTGHSVTPIGTKRFLRGMTWILRICSPGPVCQKSRGFSFVCTSTLKLVSTVASSFFEVETFGPAWPWSLIHCKRCRLSALLLRFPFHQTKNTSLIPNTAWELWLPWP